MEIFLLPPFGLGGKFEFSLCTQTRTEKLPRGGKIGRGGIRSRKFRSSLFKGLQVSKGQSPLLVLFADSHSFSRLIKRSCFGCRHWATQNVVQKEKVAVSEMISEGRSSTMFRPFIKSLFIYTRGRRKKLRRIGSFFQNFTQKSA